MKTACRLLLVVLGLCLVFATAAVVAVQVPAVRAYILRGVEARLTRHVGREIRLARADFRPRQGELELHNVRVADGLRLADGTLLAVDAVRLRWHWKALLHRSLDLDRVLLVRPRLALRGAETSAASPAEWLARLLGDPAVRLNGWTLHVRRLELQEGSASWETGEATGRLEGVNGSAERRDPAGEPSLGVSLRASRLLAPLGGRVRDMTGLAVEMQGTGPTLTITAAEVVVDGTRIAGKGRILDPVGAGRLDLDLTASAPLTALLRQAGVAREVDGLLKADGHLAGPWARPTFRGSGNLQLSQGSRPGEPIRFTLGWTDGRLEAETTDTGRPAALRARLLLEPATGAYRVRLEVRDADLGGLAGMPAAAAHLIGFTVPRTLGGRLTADVDLVGRGTDVASLRGHGTLRVDDLRTEAGLPAGRLDARVVATASQLALDTFALDVPGGTVRGNGRLIFADGRLDLPVQAEIRSVAVLARGFGLPALDGAATLGGRLTGTRDAPRFQGRLAWREPRIAMYGADRIEGDVEWLPRTLRSRRLVVRLGQTVATLQGSVTATGGAPLRALDPKRELVLDLTAEVNPGHTADLAPFLPADLAVRGGFRARGRIAGTATEPTGGVELVFGAFQAWDERWQAGDAVLRVTPGAVEITRLSMRRGAEQVDGELRIGSDGALSGRLSTTDVDLSGIAALSGSQVTGRARFILDLQGTRHVPRVVGKATADSFRFRDVPFGAGTATFTVDRKALDLSLTLGQESERLQLHLSPPPERVLRLDLSLTDADLAPLLRVAGIDVLSAAQARASGRVLMTGPTADLANAAGEATLGALRVQWKGDTWENRGPVEVGWRGRTATLRQARLHSREREFDIQGTVRDGNQADLKVSGQFPLLALAGHVPFLQPVGGYGSADLQVRGPLAAPAVRGTLTLTDGKATLTGVPAPFEAMQGTLEFEGERALIRSLEGRIAGGSVRATGEVAWHGTEWSFQTAFQEEGGRAEQLLAGLHNGKSEVAGSLSLGGTLGSRGQGAEGFWPNLNGTLKLVMLDGEFGRQTLAVRVLSLINLGKILNPKTLGISSRGMPYQRLTGDIVIEGGVAKTANLLLESRAFNASAQGQVDLVSRMIDMDVAVKPFQTLDRVVAKVPVVGWLLSGKDGAVIAAFYRVSGPLSDPTVTSLPVKNIGRNVFGIFRRLLQLPEAVTGP